MSSFTTGGSPVLGRGPCAVSPGDHTITLMIVMVFVLVLTALGQPLHLVTAVVVTVLAAVTRSLKPATRPPTAPVLG